MNLAINSIKHSRKMSGSSGSLQEAKAQIEALRKEVEKLTAPPSTFAIFYGPKF